MCVREWSGRWAGGGWAVCAAATSGSTATGCWCIITASDYSGTGGDGGEGSRAECARVRDRRRPTGPSASRADARVRVARAAARGDSLPDEVLVQILGELVGERCALDARGERHVWAEGAAGRDPPQATEEMSDAIHHSTSKCEIRAAKFNLHKK